jgi:hypothetical protein
MKIGRRIYYDKAAGSLIQDTGERSGDVIETTVEQDFLTFRALAERMPNIVDMIQLEYGQYAQDFIEGRLERIDLDTLEPLFSYPDQEQPSEPTPPQQPLTLQVASLKAELAERDRENKLAIFEVYTMLNGNK